jgi:cobalt-zinc-cadmium efflux system membrane fusion protein
VLSVDGKSLVFVQKSDGVYEQRAVELGVSGGELVEILKGLNDGDPVVAEGAFLLKSELLR